MTKHEHAEMLKLINHGKKQIANLEQVRLNEPLKTEMCNKFIGFYQLANQAIQESLSKKT